MLNLGLILVNYEINQVKYGNFQLLTFSWQFYKWRERERDCEWRKRERIFLDMLADKSSKHGKQEA